jgi:3-isopropylmalate/(R)-2-methylmalate dehydratase small subunit
MSADLEKQTLTGSSGKIYRFKINSFAKTCLLKGLDQIGWTLQFEDKIKAFEDKAMTARPWLNAP